MEIMSTSSYTQSSMGSITPRGRSQYREMCDDFRERLRSAISSLEQEKRKRETLEKLVSELTSVAEQAKCERNQFSAQIATYEEHIAIVKKKNEFLKRELENQQKITKNYEELVEKNEFLASKLNRKRNNLRVVAEYLDENDFEGVADENEALREKLNQMIEEQAALVNENTKLRNDNEMLQDQVESLGQTARDTASLQAQLATVTKQLRNKDEELQELERLLEDSRARQDGCVQVMEELQTKCAQLATVQQQNAQMKQRIQEFTVENRQLYEQIGASDESKTRLRELETATEKMKREIQQLQMENQSLRIKVQEKQWTMKGDSGEPRRSEADVIRISELTKEVESLKDDLQDYNATRIERDQLLHDVQILEAKVLHMKEIDAKNVELSLRVETLTGQIEEAEIRERRQSENITRLVSDRKELEKVRNKLLQIEDEVNERETREQHLLSKINYYKAQISENRKQLNDFEEQFHMLRSELFKARQEKSAVERELRMSEHKFKKADRQRESLRKRLDAHKSKSADAKVHRTQHREERYETTFEETK